MTGNIRWGKGAYDFDIKINEPLPSESAVFAAVADEAAFFAEDTSSSGLTGKMSYKDVESNGKVISSSVSIDLAGRSLNKQQVMYLSKLFFFVAVIPINAE